MASATPPFKQLGAEVNRSQLPTRLVQAVWFSCRVNDTLSTADAILDLTRYQILSLQSLENASRATDHLETGYQNSLRRAIYSVGVGCGI